MKICKKCSLKKPLSEFNRATRNKDGFNGLCKSCVHDRWKLWYENSENKEKNKERNRAYNKTQRGQENIHRKKLARYGISAEEFELLKASHPICPICQEREATAIDHDHNTGQVRGMLCIQCNQGLGLFLDNPEVLSRAKDYLQSRIPSL